MHCSVQPRNGIFVTGYGSMSAAKNIGKNIGKDISKSLRSKYSQKLLDHAERFATDAFKISSKRAIRKKAGAFGDLIGNKTGNRITVVSKIYNRTGQKQLQMSMMKKFLKKDNPFQKKDTTLLIIWD